MARSLVFFCISAVAWALTFTQVYFGPHTVVLRLYYLIFSGQIARSSEGTVLQSIAVVLSVAGAEGQVLDGMRWAGPPQVAVVFIIASLRTLLRGLFHTNTITATSSRSFLEIGCSLQHILGGSDRASSVNGQRPQARERSGEWIILISAEFGLHPGGEIKLMESLQGLILSCCKSARISITKVEDLTTWLYLCSLQQMIKYKCMWRWCGQCVRRKQECA